MPFITKNTFYKIISEIDLKKEPPPNKARLEGKNLTILSKKERQRLAVISEILGSEFIEENRFFTKLKKPEDTYTMLHPEKIPSYHLDSKCKALTKEYENLLIPSEIRERGVSEVIRFRRFFFDHSSLFKENEGEFFKKTREEFKISKILTKDDFAEIRAPNSGKGSIEDFNIAKFEFELDEAIREAENFKYEGPKNQLTIAKYGDLYKPELTDNDEVLIIKKWNELKKEIKRRYVVFSMIKNNPEINIDGNFLDSLGLNRCSYCCKDDNEVKFDFESKLNEV